MNCSDKGTFGKKYHFTGGNTPSYGKLKTYYTRIYRTVVDAVGRQ